MDDIEKMQLYKLAINSVVNPVTGIFKVNNGDALTGKPGEKIIELIRIVFPFFKKRDVFNSEEDFFQAVKKIAEKTSKNKNSMLMDVLSDRPTEIEQILLPIQNEVKSKVLEEIIKKLK